VFSGFTIPTDTFRQASIRTYEGRPAVS
jgi:hypothetical protein